VLCVFFRLFATATCIFYQTIKKNATIFFTPHQSPPVTASPQGEALIALIRHACGVPPSPEWEGFKGADGGLEQ